jgi:hypothetical protein
LSLQLFLLPHFPSSYLPIFPAPQPFTFFSFQLSALIAFSFHSLPIFLTSQPPRFLALNLPVHVRLPAQPVQLNALFYKFGAYLTGMKCFFFSISSGWPIFFNLFSTVAGLTIISVKVNPKSICGTYPVFWLFPQMILISACWKPK